MKIDTLSQFNELNDSELEATIGGKKFTDRDAGLAYGHMVGAAIRFLCPIA